MPTLVEELKAEHTALRVTLERVRELGIGTPEGRRVLIEARDLFVAHLAREDAEFYPAYRRATASKPHLRQQADRFSGEMSDISREVLGFFDKYAQGGGGIEFAVDYGRMYAHLFSRWSREELSLYATYEQGVAN